MRTNHPTPLFGLQNVHPNHVELVVWEEVWRVVRKEIERRFVYRLMALLMAVGVDCQ